MPQMRAAETLGNQCFDSQIEQFLAGALEHLLGFGVGVQYAALVVDFEGCIRGRFEKQGNALCRSNAFSRFDLASGHGGVLELGALSLGQIG